MTNRWLLRLTPPVPPRARLFCFPHAGVGGAVYRAWPAALPAGLELQAIQLPGRANRLTETPLTAMPRIVAAVAEELAPLLELPFAFFGHSMGAVVAVETARALAERGAPLPQHLLVSGRRPPHWPSPETPIHRLPDAEFVAEIDRRYGGIPAELAKHADVMALLLPGLRADITALETHLPPPRPPLACPISVFGGTHDRLTPREHLDAWRSETSGAFRVRVFAGDHFYLEAERAALLADLSVTLAPLLHAPGAGRGAAA